MWCTKQLRIYHCRMALHKPAERRLVWYAAMRMDAVSMRQRLSVGRILLTHRCDKSRNTPRGKRLILRVKHKSIALPMLFKNDTGQKPTGC